MNEMTPTKTPEQRRSRAVFESKMTDALLSKNLWDDHWETWQEAEEFARADMLSNPPKEMAVLLEMSNPKSEWYWKIMPKDGKPGETKSIYDIAMAIKSALKAFDEARKP